LQAHIHTQKLPGNVWRSCRISTQAALF